jgi:hypothetical protein
MLFAHHVLSIRHANRFLESQQRMFMDESLTNAFARFSRNRAFIRAIACFAHPLTWIAVLVLLFNDHVLKYAHPSWITGKLSDFAWLVFAPFFFALLIAWLIPRRVARHEEKVGLLALIGCGLFFALAKSNPVVHDWTVAVQTFLAGQRVDMRLDPSDLIALPTLLLSGAIWRRATLTALRPGLVMLAIGGLATVATSVDTYSELGITCLSYNNDTLTASDLTIYDLFNTPTIKPNVPGNIANYVSSDGGRSWLPQPSIEFRSYDSVPCKANQQNWNLADVSNPGVYYAFHPGEAILRSEDNGHAWHRELDLSGFSSQLGIVFYKDDIVWERAWYRPIPQFESPLSAAIDPQTGRLFVAMGQDGVLIRDPNGNWHWANVGGNQIEISTRWAVIGDRIQPDIFAAIVLVLLIPASLVPFRGKYIERRIVALCSAWGLWLMPTGIMVLLDGRRNDLFMFPEPYMMGFAGIVALLLSLITVYNARSLVIKIIPFMVLTAILVPLVYLTPLVLWVEGVFPTHNAAWGIAIALIGIIFLGTRPLIHKRVSYFKLKNDGASWTGG